MSPRPGWIALLAATLLPGCLAPPLEMRRFDDCDEYAAYMRRGPGIDAWSIALAAAEIDFGEVMIADLDAGGARDLPAPDSGVGAEAVWTETTLQEAGVDEADLVKTDGSYLFAISGGQLVVSTAWPVEEAAQIATLPVDGAALGLYLYEDTVVVLSALDEGESPDALSGFAAERGEAGWREAPATGITVFDRSNMAEIHVIRETYTTGVLRESRRIGDALYVVTTEEVGEEPEGELGDLAVDRALRWLPVRFDNRATADGGWESDTEPGCDCDAIWGPAGGSEAILTQVLKLDLSDPTSDFVGAGIVGPAGVVYASPTTLYLASTSEPVVDPLAEFASASLGTDLHAFDLEGSAPSYLASTRLSGVIPDRFGLSEHEGVLRVATFQTDQLTSGLSTLRVDEGGFVELDRVGGLAPGETMTAARFAGEVGYLVTYVERKDPLFVIDLADPERIQVGGELEISGWSDYLHPMAEPGKLLAIGTDFTFWGRPRLTASIFDVSDPDHPRLHDRYQFDADESEASADHHAFTYDPLTGLFSIPASEAGGEAALEVAKATADQGIRYRGRLEQPRYGGAEARGCRDIRRSIHMDGVVWAYSPAGLTAAELSAPEVPIKTLAFEGTDPCEALPGWEDDRQIEVP